MIGTSGAADDFGFPTVDVPPAACVSLQAVVRFLVGELIAQGRLPSRQAEAAIVEVLRREYLGSTAIGRGLAIPHAAIEAVSKAEIIAGRLSVPVDWQATDGAPVNLVCLLIAPGCGPLDAAECLEEVAHFLRGRT